MQWWNRYWFRPRPYVDLAMVRIIAVATQLFIMLTFYASSGSSLLAHLEALARLPDELYLPITALRVFLLPFGWDARPPIELLTIVYFATVVTGLLALIGLFTRPSLLAFAAGNIFLIAYTYSYGDFHHPEAPLFIALAVLAFGPSGHALSVDAVLRRQRGRSSASEDAIAGWPIRLIQWMFVLIYLSAVLSKIVFEGGLEWLNGFTLQYYMINDSLRKETFLGLWLSQHHLLVMISQYIVVIFQTTFVLAVIFPKLRWIYVPLGLGFHVGNIVFLNAVFLEWIALYSVFIPWRRVFDLVLKRGAMVDATTARGV